jgi:ribosomal protein S12 methylthiotransferase
MKIYLETLGCARNQVDSEVMLARLQRAGWQPTADPAAAEAIVVNTCSFIEPAVNESIDTILELARSKKQGACRRLIVVGCLPERFRQEMAASLPEVDAFLGTGAYDRVVEAVAGAFTAGACILPPPGAAAAAMEQPRTLPDLPTVYMKIAEGCDRRCSYCILPKLRGRQKSRPVAAVVAEARSLTGAGARELVLVAQETTAYGRDLVPPASLGGLLQRLADDGEISGGSRGRRDEAPVRLRFLYGHPQSIDASLLQTVASHPNICSYFDVPIQHASPSVLRRMGRGDTPESLQRLFENIRRQVPQAALRTTVIVGFPGETRQDFDVLMQFVQALRFDHLGVFIYSDFEDLPSHRLPGHVAGRTAAERRGRLMALQQEIAGRINQEHIGRIHRVLVEEQPEDNLWIGRTDYQAPEVDGVTYVRCPPGDAVSLQVGDWLSVRITGAMEYDLVGEPA